MQKFTTLSAIALLVLLTACASKPIELSAPYKMGEYRITSALITVTDTNQVTNTAFTESLKKEIMAELNAKIPSDQQLPEVGVTVIISKATHSTSGGYHIDSDVTLWANPSRQSIGNFKVAYDDNASGASTGAGAAAGFGIAGAIIGGFMGAALDHTIIGEEDPTKTSKMIHTYSENLVTKLYTKPPVK